VDWGEGLQIWRLWIHRICSRVQSTRCGPRALGLGVGLTTPHLKEVICYEMFQSASDWFLARLKQLKKDMRTTGQT
jgi:hypothetical protein